MRLVDHVERNELERRPRVGAIANDPLRVGVIHERAESADGRGQGVAALQQHDLLARRRHLQKRIRLQIGRAHGLERPLDRGELALESADMRREQWSVFVRDRESRQHAAEPFLHLPRRESRGIDMHELALEIVRLVDDEQTAPGQLLGVPVAQRREVPGVGAEDRSREGRGLGARVRTLAEAATRPATHAERRRHARVRVTLTRVVVPTLDDLHDVAELTLVLVLEQLLRCQEIGLGAPARQRHGDVALADAGRRFDDEESRRARIGVGVGQRAVEGVEQPRLRGARRESSRKVLEQARGANRRGEASASVS